MTQDFVSVTELAGDEVSAEQVERICRRYYWAGEYCREKDVLEVACGAGQGVGYLASLSKSVIAGDVSEPILAIAARHYGDRFAFRQVDAHKMPFEPSTFDVVVIFEAIYYLRDLDQFFAECKRVLRPQGVLLIVTANKDLFDFNASPHSFRYPGVPELNYDLGRFGFACEFFGDTPVQAVSTRQRVLRPLKMIASRLGLIPKTTSGKKLLKRLVFGKLVKMPAEIRENTYPYVKPTPLDPNVPDTGHKVIFCAARLNG